MASVVENMELETVDEEYGDMHKIVLQGIMSAGFLDAKGVKKLFLGACTYLKLNPTERTSMPYIQKIVREINEKIKPYDIAIKSASCELTGIKYYIFLITVEKPILKLQTLFSKFEVELFQKYLELILRKYSTFSVPVIECINMARDTEVRGSIQQAEDFINRMIQMNYFTKYVVTGKEWEVTLGFRGIREFEPILRECFQDVIAKCSLCKMLLLHGYLCPKCKLLVHKACYSRYVKTGKQCPNCKSPVWSRESNLIQRVREEVEAEVDIDFDQGPSNSQPQTPAASVGSVETQFDDDSNMEMPVLELEPSVEPDLPSFSSTRKATSSKTATPASTSSASTSQAHSLRGRSVLNLSESDSD